MDGGRGISERVGPAIFLVFGAGLGALRFAGSEPSQRSSEIAGDLAFGAALALPGLLGLSARARRPALYLGAGMLGMIFAFVSLAGVALPLLIPAAMSFVAYGRHAGEGRGRLADPVVALGVFVVGIAAVAALLVHPDPRCWTSATASSCTSDTVTAAEAGVSLALTAAAWLGGRAFARPRAS